MKYILIILLAILITDTVFSACSKKSNKRALRVAEDLSYKKNNFDSLLNNVVKNSDSLDTYKELIADSSFSKIFNHSIDYFDDAMNVLKSQKITKEKIMICPFALQILDLDPYLKLCKLYAGFYDSNEATDDIIEHLLGG